MTLIQVLLPTRSENDAVPEAAIVRTRDELVARFGGVTAYLQTAAQGVWTSSDGNREHDDVVMIEIVTERFERPWWRAYARELATRFRQDVIHVRALPVELLNQEAR